MRIIRDGFDKNTGKCYAWMGELLVPGDYYDIPIAVGFVLPRTCMKATISKPLLEGLEERLTRIFVTDRYTTWS